MGGANIRRGCIYFFADYENETQIYSVICGEKISVLVEVGRFQCFCIIWDDTIGHFVIVYMNFALMDVLFFTG